MPDPNHTTASSLRERRALRQRFRRLRRALTRARQTANSEAAARHFFAAGLHLRGRTVGLYMAADGELDLTPLLARLLRTRRRLALPVVDRDQKLTFYQFHRNTGLAPNRFGILEPISGTSYLSPLSLDLLLVPLVAFDRSGTRLGMGAGYYDRFLGRLAPGLRPRLVGVAHEVQRSDDPLPRAAWDIPLDGVLTENGWQPLGR